MAGNTKPPNLELYRTFLGYVPISASAPRPLGATYVPILLGEVEQEQRPSGNEDREAIGWAAIGRRIGIENQS